MRTKNARGFTLTELLIVIAIIGALVALLMPAFWTAYLVAQQTQCKQHLATLFKAANIWKTQNNSAILLGQGWAGQLLPYVDNDRAVFRCSGRGMADGFVDTVIADVKSPGNSGSGSGNSGNSSDNPANSPDGTNNPQPVDYAFDFDIYKQDPENSGLIGAFCWNIPLSGHPWVQRTDNGSYVHYQVDDEGALSGSGKATYDDIWFDIYYENGQPTKVTILPQACQSSPLVKYIYNFKVNGKVFIANWQKSMSFTIRFDGPGATDPKNPGNTMQWNGVASLASALVLTDYGLNEGTFISADPTRFISKIDGKLFFLLDYGKPEAKYSGTGDQDDWAEYFIQDTNWWTKKYGTTGENWYDFQSLRHFAQANVVFCDGHIESLGYDDLSETNPLWKYSGL